MNQDVTTVIFESAKWIWLKQETPVANQYVCFRSNFENIQPDANTFLYISVDTDFIVYVNGQEAGRFQFTDYPENKTYSEFSITEFLREGINSIAVLAYHCGENFSTYRKGSPGLLASVMTGNEHIAQTDKNWKCIQAPFFTSGPMPKTSNQLGFTICADGRKLDRSWIKTDYNDDAWSNAAEAHDKQPEISPRPLPPLKYGERIPADLIMQGFLKRNRQGISFAEISSYDTLLFRPLPEVFEKESINIPDNYQWAKKFLQFGRESATEPVFQKLPSDDFNGYFAICDLQELHAGLIELSITAAEGTVLDISYGEHLDDGRVRCNVGGRNFTDRYICAEGRNDFTFPFKRASGRYIELHITGTINQKITLHYLGLRPLSCALIEEKDFFKCSDRLTEKLHTTAVRTLDLCMHDHYEDCPWREQALYSYDSRNQALYGYYLWGNYDFAAASIDLLGQGIRDDGFLELCAPAKIGITIPIFAFVWVAELYEHYLHTGSLILLKKYISQIESMVDKALSQNDSKTGLYITGNEASLWHFYEWTDGIDGRKKPADGFILQAGYNMYLYEMLIAFIKLLKAHGDNAKSGKITEVADKLKTSINEVFWNEKEGIYSAWINPDSSKGGSFEHIQAIAVFNGLADESKTKSIIDNIRAGKLEKISLSSMCYMLRAFMNIDENTRSLMSRMIAETFEPIVLKGYSALWETGNGSSDFSGAGSLCHGWSSLPAYYANCYILGIMPLDAGFKRFKVAPYPDRLYNARGTVATPYGNINVEWHRIDGNKIIYTAKGPEELQAVLAPYPEIEIVSATYNSKSIKNINA